MNGNIIENTEKLLKGDYGFMCQYDHEPDFETIWSSIFDLESLRIYRAEGDPRKNKFITDSRLQKIDSCSTIPPKSYLQYVSSPKTSRKTAVVARPASLALNSILSLLCVVITPVNPIII